MPRVWERKKIQLCLTYSFQSASVQATMFNLSSVSSDYYVLYIAKLHIYLLLPFDSFLLDIACWLYSTDFEDFLFLYFHLFSTYYNIVRLQLLANLLLVLHYYTFQILFIIKYYNELWWEICLWFFAFHQDSNALFFHLSSFFVTQYFFLKSFQELLNLIFYKVNHIREFICFHFFFLNICFLETAILLPSHYVDVFLSCDFLLLLETPFVFSWISYCFHFSCLIPIFLWYISCSNFQRKGTWEQNIFIQFSHLIKVLPE